MSILTYDSLTNQFDNLAVILRIICSFAGSSGYTSEKHKSAVSRMKKNLNNNTSKEVLAPAQTVVVQQGRKVRSSLMQHEQQQDELFEL